AAASSEKSFPALRSPLSVSSLLDCSRNSAASYQTSGWCPRHSRHCSACAYLINLPRLVMRAWSSVRSGFPFSQAMYFFQSSTWCQCCVLAKKDDARTPTCLASSGVPCGGTEGEFLLRPRVTASYSLATRRAFIYSRLRSEIIFSAISRLIPCKQTKRSHPP
ncbi:unnamed protein product, partial [Ixodes hexagonus]